MAEKYYPVHTPPGTSGVGDSVTEGTAPSVPRADHKHGREAYGTPIAITSDGTPGAGSGTDVVRANHQHTVATYASVPPAIGTGSAGTVNTAPSRGDHTHTGASGTFLSMLKWSVD